MTVRKMKKFLNELEVLVKKYNVRFWHCDLCGGEHTLDHDDLGVTKGDPVVGISEQFAELRGSIPS